MGLMSMTSCCRSCLLIEHYFNKVQSHPELKKEQDEKTIFDDWKDVLKIKMRKVWILIIMTS